MNSFTGNEAAFVVNGLRFLGSASNAVRSSVFAKWLALAAMVVVFLTQPVQALTFNVTYDSSVTSLSNASQVEVAFAAAAQVLQSLYTNAVTINLTVYFSSSVDLGESYTELSGNPTYAQLTNALRAARTTVADSNAVASLPQSDPTGGPWWIPRAEAKVLGRMGAVNIAPNDPSQDGSVSFASTVNYTFDPNNRAVANKFDFIGVAEHEITEMMGRIHGLDDNISGYVPYDLFRFTNTADRSFGVNDTNVYFSINDGASALKYFYTNVNLGDIQDWQSSSPPDAFDAFVPSGHKLILSSADLVSVDILGYDLNFPPPHLTGTWLSNGNFQISFTSAPGMGFAVLTSTNLSLPLSDWAALGAPTESPAGQYQFIDSRMATNQPHFYRVSLP